MLVEIPLDTFQVMRISRISMKVSFFWFKLSKSCACSSYGVGEFVACASVSLSSTNWKHSKFRNIQILETFQS